MMAHGYVVYALQSTLYSDFYCRGFATPSQIEMSSFAMSWVAPFVEQLSQSNNGCGYWDSNWTATKKEAGEIILFKAGLTLWAQEEDCLTPDGGDILPAAKLSLRFPAESTTLSPGYYMALSNDRLQEEEGEPVVRFYWNVTPKGSAVLLRAITSSLNDANLPFRFKVLNDPAHFVRCDAGVLYVRKSDYDALAPILERLYGEIAHDLKPLTPVFTKQLAPGLGFAEDPGGGESFGLHRCRMVAEGLLRAYERRAKGTHARLQAVLDTLEANGIDIDHPYLNPGSRDNYAFDVGSRPANPRRNAAARKFKVGSTTGEEPYLGVAQSIAYKIVRDALWHEGLCNWMGGELRPNEKTGQYDPAYAALGPTVYSGTAGIALFLGELWSVAPDDTVRRTALGAIRHALSRADMVTPATRSGLYSGWAGMALVAARLGTILREESLLDGARGLVARLVQDSREEWENDLLTGRAGGIVALIILSRALEDGSFLASAASLGDDLLLSADKSAHGYSWKSGINRSAHNLTGFSHGTAGIGHGFLELWQVTQEARYLEAARRAFDYERYWFDSAACNWPDFRLEPGDALPRHAAGPGKKKWPAANAWCNGAPGIALSRLRAYEILKEDVYREEAVAALEATREAIEASLYSGSGNYSLCHGLAGNAEVLLSGERVLGSNWPAARAATQTIAEVAHQGVERYQAGGQPWPSGLVRGDTPNLMLGLAGTGHFYLRRYRPSVPSIVLVKGEEWSGAASTESS